MWKLLPVCLLVSCAANDQYQPDSVGHQSDPGRIVRQVELPVTSPAQNANAQPSRKTFQATGMQGWLDETGYWHIESEIHHGRLRCATYAAGLQFGKGNPACSDVEWLTGVDYATRLRHCNSATRLHAGGGMFAATTNRLEAVSCVRIVVHCEGVC